MEANDAARVVNGLAHHPDVHLIAVDVPERFEETIVIRVHWPHAVNSNESEAPTYAGPPIGPYADYVVYVGDLDDDSLLATVIDVQCDAFTHEIREFTRQERNGRWAAPFHPHRHAGQQAWHRHHRRAAEPDDTFGPKFDKRFERIS